MSKVELVSESKALMEIGNSACDPNVPIRNGAFKLTRYPPLCRRGS
jgi:hypothetical protein